MPSTFVNHANNIQKGTKAYTAGSDPVCWVVVGDGKLLKVLEVYKRQFRFIQKIDQPDLAIDELNNDSIGRGAHYAAGRHGYEPSMEESHQQEIALAKKTSLWLEEQFNDHKFRTLVLVASPQMLGELRKNLSARLLDVIVAEANKNLTNSNKEDLEQALLKIIPGPDKE
jgi:protein required for attachment to host cells